MGNATTFEDFFPESTSARVDHCTAGGLIAHPTACGLEYGTDNDPVWSVRDFEAPRDVDMRCIGCKQARNLVAEIVHCQTNSVRAVCGRILDMLPASHSLSQRAMFEAAAIDSRCVKCAEHLEPF